MGERLNGVLKRRGLLAGAAALATAGLAKLDGADRVKAAHFNSDEAFIHAGAFNTTTNTTAIVATLSSGPSLAAANGGDTAYQSLEDGIQGFSGGGNFTAGVRGSARASVGETFGVLGLTNSSTVNASGVKGQASSGATNGVWGQNTSTADTATGTFGLASAATGATVGVWGRSQSGTDGATGTRGEATAPSGATTGVLGRVSSPAGIAVRGIGGSGVGVFGGSGGNIGVYADSASSTAVFATSPARGVWGRTTAGIGVFAQATAGGTVQNRSYGLYAAAPGPGWAGYFEGNVYVTGQVIQAGAAASTATAADGSTRAVYSVDSAEPLVEDVGEGKLVGGRAEVKLDPDFAAIADGGTYQVFLTPEGDSKGLYVTEKSPGGFVVREQQNGTASLAFAYRVVAKRKGAIGKRLEKLERPKGLQAKDLEPPKPPEAVAPPEKPAAESKPERREAR